MPVGRVKMFDAERSFGFLLTADGDELYVAAAQVSAGPLNSGDEVEYEVGEGDHGRRVATAVRVTKAAPSGSPVGRTMLAPPSWDDLEDRERQRRMARRRRR
jgi:cold shock CspA family protein